MSRRRGSRPAWRDVHGLLLLDKPAGISSNEALQRVRRLYRAAKAGHTGALDPLATGLLPVCFGEATKIAGLLLGASKAYTTVAKLGVVTDSDDADGEVLIERAVPVLERGRVESVLAGMVGRIQQRPPIYSALKRGGEPLYAKARRGEHVEVEPREVEVHAIRLLEIAAERLSLEVTCGSGTYIRSLVRDLGEALGCGAHVEQLRRLWIEPFRAPRMLDLDALGVLAEQGDAALDSALLPLQDALPDWRRVSLDAEQATRLRMGQQFAVEQAAGAVLAIDAEGRALGLAEISETGMLAPKRMFLLP